jgi:hypothetical protein
LQPTLHAATLCLGIRARRVACVTVSGSRRQNSTRTGYISRPWPSFAKPKHICGCYLRSSAMAKSAHAASRAASNSCASVASSAGSPCCRRAASSICEGGAPLSLTKQPRATRDVLLFARVGRVASQQRLAPNAPPARCTKCSARSDRRRTRAVRQCGRAGSAGTGAAARPGSLAPPAAPVGARSCWTAPADSVSAWRCPAAAAPAHASSCCRWSVYR